MKIQKTVVRSQKSESTINAFVSFILCPKRIIFIAFSLIVFTGFALVKIDKKVIAAVGINETINFQGKVVNSNGTNVADGQYTFVFRLYDAASGGANPWTETQNNVQVTGGIFRVALGSVTSFSGVDFNTDNLYLSIEFNSDGEMDPRIRFAAVPYAMNAKTVSGLTVTDTTGTFTLANSKIFTVSNSLTLQGTDSTVFTFPNASGTVVTLDSSQILSNKSFSSTVTFDGITTDITTDTDEILTISPNGTGNVLVQTGAGGRAALVVDKTGLGDIFAASSSGVPKFVIKSDGNASSSAGFTVNGEGGLQSTDYQTLTIGGGTTGDLVIGRTSQNVSLPGFSTCTLKTSGGLLQCGTDSGILSYDNFWQYNSSTGVVANGNLTTDLLLGGTSTQSAKFSVSGIAGTDTPVASVSATSGQNANKGLSISGDGSLQSVRMNDLAIGGNTTGNIYLRPGNSQGLVKLIHADSGSGGLVITTNETANTDKIGRLKFGSYSGGPYFTGILASGEVTANQLLIGGGSGSEYAATNIRFRTSENVNTLTGTERMRIDNKGWVGIGEIGDANIPLLSQLYVTGGSQGANAAMIVNQTGLATNDILTGSSSGTTRFVINGQGRLGLNTGANNSTLLSTMDVRSNGVNGGTISVASISGATSFAGLTVDNFGIGDLFTASSSSNTQFVIKSNGAVGIGNDARIPTAQLDVAGAASISGGLTFRTGTGTISTSSFNSLNIGGSTTGNILFQPNGDTTNNLLLTSNGSGISLRTNNASNLTLDTGGAAVLNLGTTNATSAVLGSSTLGSFTVTTNSTGDTEVVLPNQSIGSAEIVNNSLDYDKFASAMTLDESTTVSFSTLNYILDLTSTGEFFIRDAGNTFAYFMADGTITLGKTSSASTLNFGTGTGADNISIGDDNTSGDTIVVGNNNASTTLSLTGGDDWSVTTGGAATFASLSGSGLSDCDASTSKLQWNDATGTFSCGTDLGSNLQIVSYSDTSTEVAAFTAGGGAPQDLWDGTAATITPGSTNSEILISVNIRGTSDDANDHNPVFTIRRNIGSAPTCSSTQVGGEFVGGFVTTTAYDWGATVTTSDAPGTTSVVYYTVCSATTGLDDANSDEIYIVLTEIGSSSAGGGGNVAVRESDGSPSVASASTIEFGPATTSSDEFIVTDEGSGVARIQIGDQVGLLNQAETVTGGWTFNTGNTTFTTAVNLNGGLTTSTSDQNLAFSANGAGDFVFTIDNNSGVLIGSSSNTLAPLSVSGGIGSNAAFVLNQLNNGDIIAASYSGTTMFVVDNTGSITAAGSINLSTGNIDFSSTGGIVLNGGTISDDLDEVDINDDLAVNGNITLTGTTGLTLTGSGADLVFTNLETIDNDSNGTLTFGRNDAGTVTLTAKDNDATAALSILSGGASALTIDTGGAATLGVGTTNATTITIGNTASSTSLNLTKGASGNIVLTGFNCSTFTNGGVLTTDSSGNIDCQNDDGGAATATYWDSSLGALYPNNTTYDLLLGGTSTASAKFGFLNIDNGGVPTATISATTGNALSLNANGSITTTKAQRLTLGGGDSGEVYTASLLRIDPTLGVRGGGLSDCDNPTTSKLLWDTDTNRFSCGTDQGGGGGSSMTVRESDSAPAVSAVAVLEFGPGSASTDEFIVTDEGSNIARVRIGNQVGLLNEAETVTGGWTFNTGNTTFTTAVNLNGGLTTTTTDQNLAFSANGAGDFVFTIDSGTNVQLTGGVDGTDAFVISAGDILLSDGDFDLSGGDFNVTLDAGDTFNVSKSGASAGDVVNLAASSVNSIDGLQIDLTSTSDSGADTYNGLNITWAESSDADIVNAINIPNTTSTNSTATGIVIGTGWDTGILVNSGGVSIVAGGLTISAGALAVNSDSITSDGSTLTIDAGGTVQISDDLTVTGTTGLTLAGTGADIVFANSESIDNDSNGVITFGTNTAAGGVTLTAKDTDSTSALTIQSGGATTLTLDAGGAAGVAVGTTNANAITIGNTTNGTGVTINSGTGNINIGDNAVNRVIEIGGVDNDATDNLSISTNASSADTINIGNANSSTTMALTGGNDWSITAAGAATFTSFDGAGLSADCDTAITSKVMWDTTTNTFSCGTDNVFAQSKTFADSTQDTSVSWVTDTDVWDGTQPNMTLTSTNNRVLVSFTANITTDDANDQQASLQIRRAVGGSASCSSTQIGESILGPFLTTASQEHSITGTFLDTGSFTASDVANYTICTGGHANDLDDGTVLGLTMTLVEVGPAGADLAEVYYSDEPILPGELVALDSNIPVKVRKTAGAYDKNTIGVVSTQPGLVLGTSENYPGKPVMVALSGRVPVKVSSENGPIKTGDLLTSSSTPGVAMKADRSGIIVAQAMEDFSGEGVGTVLGFIKNSYSLGVGRDALLEGLSDQISNSLSEKHKDFELISHLVKTATPSSQITTDVLVAGLKVISSEVSAEKINVSGLSILNGDQMSIDLGENGELVIKNDKSETRVRFDESGNAYFAGDVVANKVKANKIEGLEFIVSDLISTDSAKLSIEKSLQNLKNEQQNLASQMASISAMLSRMGPVSLLSGDDDTLLTSVDNLSVAGTTTLSDTYVLDNLTVGSGSVITFSNGSINSLGNDLFIQDLKQGAVDFLAGAVKFEASGKAIFSEDVEFKKNVNVTGVLSAKTVSATDLLLGKGETVELSDDEVEATSAAGMVVLKKEHDKVRVNNPLVKDASFIFITPKTNTSRTLFLLEQSEAKEDEEPHFVVGIDRKTSEDIKFNYLIVN